MGKTKKDPRTPISVHVTDEERAQFMAGMAADHMVDLGPWCASIIRKHLSDQPKVMEALQRIEGRLDSLEKAVASRK